MGAGLTEERHRDVDQLVHEIAEDSFTEFVYTGSRIDAIEVYTDATKTILIRTETFTYAGNRVTKIVTKQHDASGSLITGETLTEDITYVGNKVDDIAGAIT